MGDIFEEVPPYATSEERSEEDEERNQDEEEEQDSDSDSDMVIESEDEDVSDREIDDQDPWETLRQEVPSQRKMKENKMMMTTERFLGVQTKEDCLCDCAFVY